MTDQLTDPFATIESAKAPDAYMANYDGFEEDWISTSALATFMKCQIQGQFKYLEKLPECISIRRTCGSAAHKGREHNLRQKIESHEDLPVEEVTDAARDFVNEQFDTHEVQVEAEFEGKNKKQACGIAVDLSTEFAAKDHDAFQSEIQPDAVEESMAIRFPGVSRIVVGKLDVREGETIRDLKTGKRAYGQGKADDNMGITTYGMLKKAETGVAPVGYMVDNIVDSKTGCKHNLYPTMRTEVQLQQQLGRFKLWCNFIDAGVFAPGDPQEWWCSREWCAFHSRCPHQG